jgi:hypothetical protein
MICDGVEDCTDGIIENIGAIEKTELSQLKEVW